jgi:hypothetical protein
MEEIKLNEQLSKKERIRLHHEEKRAYQKSLEKQRKIKRIITWSISIALIFLGMYGIVILSRQGQKARPGEIFAIQGQQHIDIGASHIAYNSNPPTSGPHYVQPANWGVYQTELPDEQLIHNLEHGGIWISYTGIASTTQIDLEKLAKSYTKIIVEPRTKDDAPIILASWGRLEKFQTYDEQAIVAFIKANTNKSPEPMAQ